MSDTPKQIQVINGDGKDLEISPVDKYISIQKPKTNQEKKEIIIPKEKK